ncbi:MAG: geranylgeranyl reductase family protein [Cutibacterium granulosum]|uniref:Drug:proton antiporter n=2 Tax=Cutibacterium granulosum TaxID=33011 RepID=U1GE17_9ACTN|nr:geranylgeranyl reductase family protein [Cutibacterium granulosum]ERF56455.1 Geranylgeranyl reductase family protein [Cutibacterium granulosum DSM 20700]ERF67902.1 Geranylgeranyl reductase family protein [Cutibacterium granulosum TM11]MBS5253695.1 geranylgeranyl reductase family protein [Cutibacterium granulosum]MDU3768201.1 geranylgeranyl reductase family protein [Cutibacterium granulosum]
MANVGGRGVCADALVVGAGPGGSATAANLARQGLHVVLLEKATFPRDKVCGDGLTPRAVRQLIRLGIDVSEEAGWKHTQGLRIHGGTVPPFVLPWPELADYPNFGMVCRRAKLDEMLARHAESLGVELITRANVKTPIMDERTGRIVGVRTTDGREFHAPVVVAADGNSSRLALAMGRERRPDRPMGVAVRAYFTSPLSQGDHLESWLELWDGKPHESDLLPGYGWAFPVGDGTVNVGLGMLNSSDAFQKTDYRSLMTRWLSHLPAQWGLTPDNQEGPIRGAALPMAFNRTPAYDRGLLLVGDAGGMVNPFNGEGIDYAMEAGELAATAIAQAHYRGMGSRSAERALQGYSIALRERFGGYFRLGTIFVKLIGDPRVMRLCTTYGLPHATLMGFVNKLLANLTDSRGGDVSDHVINALTRLAPST